MTFRASWNSISNTGGGGISITGNATRYAVRWGDGAQTVARPTKDSDGDGIVDTSSTFHLYDRDSIYDVQVFALQWGLPPIRLKAFMFAGATDNVSINGSGLSDAIVTGSGNDAVNGGDGDDVIGGGDGQDRLNGGDGDDFVLGYSGNDVILGGNGSDLLTGMVGDDRLYGGAGIDSIYGDAGRDTLLGGDGNDYLDGGDGADRLFGGAGADLFGITPPRDANNNPLPGNPDPNRDLILDFEQGIDRLSINRWSAERFSYVGSGAFSGDGPEVRSVISGGDTIVFGDADGDRIVDFSIRLIGAFTLTGDDFRI